MFNKLILGGETAIIIIVQPNFDSLEDNYGNLTTSHIGEKASFYFKTFYNFHYFKETNSFAVSYLEQLLENLGNLFRFIHIYAIVLWLVNNN